MNEDVIHMNGPDIVAEMDALLSEFAIIRTAEADDAEDIRNAGRRMLEIIRRLEALQEVANYLVDGVIREMEGHG